MTKQNKWDYTGFCKILNDEDNKIRCAVQLKDVNLMRSCLTENEQLKSQLKECFARERDTKNKWRKLKEENKKLKKSCTSLEIDRAGLTFEVYELLRENEDLIVRCSDGEQIIRELKEENKQLKQQLNLKLSKKTFALQEELNDEEKI